MGPDFHNRAELYGYTERRVVVDVNRYARYFLSMGNVFRESSPGIYDAHSGDLLVDYVKGGYTLDKSRKVHIHSWADFEEATDDVYNHHGMCTISRKNLKRVQVTEKPPLNRIAAEAAASVFGKLMRQNYEYVQIGKNVPDLPDLVYMDDIEDNTRRWNLLRQMEEAMVTDIDLDLKGAGWKEMIFHKRNGTYMVDVMLDIRIKDYYERLFDRLDREADERREREYEGHTIHCS